MADNLLLGAEIVLEDSSTIQKEVESVVSKIQKDIDGNPIELKTDISEAEKALKLIDSSISSLQKSIDGLRNNKVDITTDGDNESIVKTNTLLSKTTIALNEIKSIKGALGDAINIAASISANEDLKTEVSKVVSDIQKKINESPVTIQVKDTDAATFVRTMKTAVDDLHRSIITANKENIKLAKSGDEQQLASLIQQLSMAEERIEAFNVAKAQISTAVSGLDQSAAYKRSNEALTKVLNQESTRVSVLKQTLLNVQSQVDAYKELSEKTNTLATGANFDQLKKATTSDLKEMLAASIAISDELDKQSKTYSEHKILQAQINKEQNDRLKIAEYTLGYLAEDGKAAISSGNYGEILSIEDLSLLQKYLELSNELKFAGEKNSEELKNHVEFRAAASKILKDQLSVQQEVVSLEQKIATASAMSEATSGDRLKKIKALSAALKEVEDRTKSGSLTEGSILAYDLTSQIANLKKYNSTYKTVLKDQETAVKKAEATRIAAAAAAAAAVKRLAKRYAELSEVQKESIKSGDIDITSLLDSQLKGAINYSKDYQATFSEITAEYEKQRVLQVQLKDAENKRNEIAKLQSKYTDDYVHSLKDATNKERELGAAALDRLSELTKGTDVSESYAAMASEIKNASAGIETSADRLVTLNKEVDSVRSSMLELNKQWSDVNKQASYEGKQGDLDTIRQQVVDYRQELAKLLDEQQRLKGDDGATFSIIQPKDAAYVSELRAEIEKLNDEFLEGKAAFEKMESMPDVYNPQQLKEYSDYLSKIGDEIVFLNKDLDNAYKGSGRITFENGVESAEKLNKQFRAYISSITETDFELLQLQEYLKGTVTEAEALAKIEANDAKKDYAGQKLYWEQERKYEAEAQKYLQEEAAAEAKATQLKLDNIAKEEAAAKKAHEASVKQRAAETKSILDQADRYAQLSEAQKQAIESGVIDFSSLDNSQLKGAINYSKDYQKTVSLITDENEKQKSLQAQLSKEEEKRNEIAKLRAKYNDDYVNSLSEATNKEKELKAQALDIKASITDDSDIAASYTAQANELRKVVAENEAAAAKEKEHLETTKQREAIVSRFTKLYANLTSEQRRQVRLGDIGNISTESEDVLKRMIKYSKEYSTHVGVTSDEVKTQESLVKSLELKILDVSKAAKLASAEYQALSNYILEGNVEETDTTLDNSTLNERLKMSELIASTLDRQSAEYAKHVAYQQSITAALKYQSVEALKSMEAQAAAMDTSSIEARSAKIAVLEKLIRSVNDETEEGKKKQDEWANSISKLNAENAKFTSRTAELKKQTAATEASTKATKEQARIEQSIISILSGAATTENAINEAIRERVKLQGTLLIGDEKYLQNKREIDQLTEKLPANIRKSTEAYSNQASVVQQMKGMVDDYIGLYAAFRGMNSIVQTTADFEMQKVALTALSGSMIDTEKIWSQIAAQSVKSPFALKDLVTYTKQLSAYRIENDKLFDTTKQLADISAGLGVEMGRIILAYGQVKAATVLRGTELRQFTEAGFDLLPALAQKFTELNGTVVTTAEVFDLISERAVPFEMVAEVFDDMTAAGGRFYNMQEIQSETTRGLLINIGDQADLTRVALGEMNSELIKGVLSGTKGVLEFAANNALLVNSILSVVGAGGAYILSIGIQNEVKRRYNSAIKDEILLQGLQKNGISEVTAKSLLNAKATLLQNTSQKKLTKTQLYDIAVKQNLTREQIKYFIATNSAAASNNILVRSFAKLKLAFATNPVTAWAVAIGAVVGIFSSFISKSNKQIEKIKEMRVELERLTAERAKSEKVLREATNFDDQVKAFENYKELLEGQGINIKLNIDKDNVKESIEAAIAEANALAAAKGRITIALAEESPISWDSNVFNPFSWVDDMTDSYEKVRAQMTEYNSALLNEMATLRLLKNPSKEQSKRLNELVAANAKLAKVSRESNTETERLTKTAAIFAKTLSGIDLVVDDSGYTDPFSAILARMEVFDRKYKKASENVLQYVKDTVDTTSSSAGGQIALAINEAASKENMQQFIPDFINYVHDALHIEVDIEVKSPKSALKDWQKEYNDFVDSIEATTTKKAIEVKIDQPVTPTDFIGSWLDDLQGEADKKEIEVGVTLPTKIEYEDIVEYDDQDLRNKLNQFRITEAMSAVEQTEMASKLNAELEKQGKILKEIDAGTISYKDEDAEKIKKYVEYLVQMRDRLSLLTKEQADAAKSSAAVSLLKEELSLLDSVNKAYADNLKVMSPDAAAKAVKDLYGDVFGNLENFKGLKPTDVIDVAGLNSQYEKAKTIINKLLGEGTAKANKVILEFDNATTQNSAKEAMAIVKAEIDKLNKDIAKQQEASNFMDKILGLTSGNMELATSITMSVYGNTGEELEKAMVEQVRKAFSGGGVSSAVAKGVEDAIDGTDVDFVALQGLIEQLPEDMRSSAEKIVKEGISANAKIVEDLYKNLSKTKSYEDKRTDILRAGIKQRREIEESDLKSSEKSYLTGLSKESESKQLKQLEFTDFKESDMYIQMFDRLETTSTATLDLMKRKLEDMREAWKDGLEPTQLKELQSRLNEISSELDTRGNPFKKLKESLTEYRSELAKASLEQREAALLKAQDIESEEKTEMEGVGNDLLTQEQEIAAARAAGDAERLAFAEAFYATLLEVYGVSKEEYEAAKKTTEARQEDVNTVTNLSAKIKKLFSETSRLKKMLVSSMVDFADASNEAIQSGVFGNLSDEAKDVADDVLSVASTIGQVTISTIGDIESIVSGSTAAMVGASTAAAEAIKSVERASVILAIISAVLQIATKIAQVISGNKEAKADAAIEKAQMQVDSLNNSIEDLGDKADESFGKAKIGAMKMQDELREQQALAYDAMILAEQSRKEPDQSQIAEWQREADVLRKEIKDTGEYFEAYMGTSQTEAFKTLKDAWFELWKDVDSTAIDRMNNMKNAWREMLQNMIMEQMAMKIIQAQMKPLFDKIEQTITNQDGVVTDEQIEGWLAEGDAKIEALFPQLELIGQWMEKMGVRTTEVSDSSDGSLAQGVASATSEEVTTLSGYMSSVLQYQILSYAILDRWEKTGYGGVTIAGTDSKAQDGTFHLAAISTNTLNAANTLAEIREILDGVTTPIGSDKGISINVDVVG